MKWTAIIVLVLAMQTANAVTCNQVSSKDIDSCNAILQSSLAAAEKEALISSLIYPASAYANHSFVYDWNTNIQFTAPPDGMKTQDSGSIKDAWMKIISVMPSVISKDKLLTSGIGTIQTAYNYRVEMPSGTENGDCMTEYNLRSNNPALNVYLNDNLIGNSPLTKFQGANVLNFKSVLNINVDIEARHYKNYRWCCKKSRRGYCEQYCEECRYDGTGTISSTLTIEDIKKAYQHWPVIKPKIRAVDSYLDTYVGILNITDFDAVQLVFENSSLSQFNYNYEVITILSPYNVLTLKASNFTRHIADNLNYQQAGNSYKFYVSNPKGCKIIFYSHFSNWEQICNLKFEFPELSIETDKLQYNEKEPINVLLEPKNTLMKVKYGNEEKSSQNQVQFEAKKNYNKITVQLNDREIQKVIHVKDDKTWGFALNLGVFSSVLYGIYLALKKYWGVLL